MVAKSEYNKVFANNLRRIMHERDKNGADMARYLGVGKFRVSSWMNAQQIPDAYVLRAGGWSTPHVMQKVYRHALDNEHLEYSQKAVSAFQNPFQ